jgi:hypothetical protein
MEQFLHNICILILFWLGNFSLYLCFYMIVKSSYGRNLSIEKYFSKELLFWMGIVSVGILIFG